MKYSPLVFLTIALPVAIYSQGPQDRGVELYRAGQYAEARKLLSVAIKDKVFERNAEIWNYLGLSYLGELDYKNGRKAFEKAAKIEPGKVIYHLNLAYSNLLLRDLRKVRSEANRALDIEEQNLPALLLRGTASYWDMQLDDAQKDADKMLSLNDKYSEAYFLKSRILVARMARNLPRSNMKSELPLLEDAVAVIKSGVDRCPVKGGCSDLTEELKGLTVFVEHFERKNSETTIASAETPPPPPEPGVTPIKIISKPRPSYTDRARTSNTQGTIILAILFGADGKVQQVLPLKRLGNGLDEEAIIAARKIKFQPETKDGKPIPVVKQVEYSFSIY
jgi:TonB family protein